MRQLPILQKWAVTMFSTGGFPTPLALFKEEHTKKKCQWQFVLPIPSGPLKIDAENVLIWGIY